MATALDTIVPTNWPNDRPSWRMRTEGTKVAAAIAAVSAALFGGGVTSASTSGSTSVEPLLMDLTMTGAGGVGGRAHFKMTTNVALGGWSNALKGEVVYGASGKTAGLGSAIVAEMTLEAGAADGTYAPLEIELNMPSGALTGTLSALLYMSVNGAAKATFDTNGFLFSLQGLTANSGKLFDDLSPVDVQASGRLRVKVGATTYYIPLCALEGLNDS